MKNVLKINLKAFIRDSAFIIMGYICIFFYNKYNTSNYTSPMMMPVAIAVAIITIHVLPIRKKENKYIYENKKAIVVYCIVHALLLISIFTLNNLFGLNNSTKNFNRIYGLLIQLGISLTIFICYFFKIKLKEFNWNMSVKSFILVIIVYVVFELTLNFNGISDGTIHINNIFNIKFILNFVINTITKSLYPGVFEEILFRGFLISGLKGFGLSDGKNNIIQAIIFGISHVMSWGTASWVLLLATALQVMMGYVLGKIYFKTKSLAPCILFHGLINAM